MCVCVRVRVCVCVCGSGVPRASVYVCVQHTTANADEDIITTKVPYTIVWKIFVWNYFVVRNIQEKNFHAFPVPTKIF